MNGIDAYITCPFNKSHRILKARFQTHLVKCRKNYPRDMKVVCKYDATHLLDPEEYEHHLSVCATSGNIKSYQNQLESNVELGTVSLEEACSHQPRTINEDWSGNHPTYDPYLASKDKVIIRTISCLSKLKKKQFKQQERDRISALENINCSDNINDSTSTIERQIDLEQPLRIPKNTAKAISYNQEDLTSDIISKVKQLDIKESDSSLRKEDASIMNSNSPLKVTDKENSLKDSTINTSSSSMVSTNKSKKREKGTKKENISVGESNTATATAQPDVSEAKETVSKVDNSKTKHKYEKADTEKSNLQINLNKESNCQPGNTMRLNSRLAAKIYGEAKKISTGRGFTIAYQNLNMSMERTKEDNENLSNLSSEHGYDEQ